MHRCDLCGHVASYFYLNALFIVFWRYAFAQWSALNDRSLVAFVARKTTINLARRNTSERSCLVPEWRLFKCLTISLKFTSVISWISSLILSTEFSVEIHQNHFGRISLLLPTPHWLTAFWLLSKGLLEAQHISGNIPNWIFLWCNQPRGRVLCNNAGSKDPLVHLVELVYQVQTHKMFKRLSCNSFSRSFGSSTSNDLVRLSQK